MQSSCQKSLQSTIEAQQHQEWTYFTNGFVATNSGDFARTLLNLCDNAQGLECANYAIPINAEIGFKRLPHLPLSLLPFDRLVFDILMFVFTTDQLMNETSDGHHCILAGVPILRMMYVDLD